MNENKDPRKVQQNIETHKVLYFAPSVLIITENKLLNHFLISNWEGIKNFDPKYSNNCESSQNYSHLSIMIPLRGANITPRA